MSKLRKRLGPKLLREICDQFEIHSDNGIPPFALLSLSECIAEELNCTEDCVKRAIHTYKFLQYRKTI